MKNLLKLLLVTTTLTIGCYEKKNKDLLTYKDTILKPKVLFHGSRNRNIQVLKPTQESVQGKSEDPVIFCITQSCLCIYVYQALDGRWVTFILI